MNSIQTKSVVGKTKLTRQAHYEVTDNLAGVPVSQAQALDDIYYCFDMCMKGEKIRRDGDDDADDYYGGSGEERKEGDGIRGAGVEHLFWENEFMFRDPYLDHGREIIRLSAKEDDVFAEGIREFREKTHVVFKDMFFGMMWKIMPKSESMETCRKGFDGCFTKNYDGIMEKMDIVDQNEQFGTILDITLEAPKYILWTSFS